MELPKVIAAEIVIVVFTSMATRSKYRSKSASLFRLLLERIEGMVTTTEGGLDQ